MKKQKEELKVKGKIRDIFPGGNTCEGFYSYYDYILEQEDAASIVCLKGGPGTGKSSFMKEIAAHFIDMGEDVDLFWCSSDPDSLDGVLLKERKVALLDGTAPHVVDPKSPGAVDTIIHLGEFWDGGVLKQYKNNIMQSNNKIGKWFDLAYNNLKAAAALRRSINDLYSDMMLPGELYMEAAMIVNREFSKYPVTLAEAKRKKYFASAITPKGIVSHLDSITSGFGKIYYFMAPVGFDNSRIMKVISENAVHRGFAVEEYYCPMNPENGLEHLLIPELDIAFVTLDDYHDIEGDRCRCGGDVNMLELRDFIDWSKMEPYMDTVGFCERESEALIEKAVGFLKEAKAEHDRLEGYYIPNMKFDKIEALRNETISKILENVI